MKPPAEDMLYGRDDGARLRIDRVANGWVYFVSWKPGQVNGCAKRMPAKTFDAALVTHGMQPTEAPTEELQR